MAMRMALQKKRRKKIEILTYLFYYYRPGMKNLLKKFFLMKVNSTSKTLSCWCAAR